MNTWRMRIGGAASAALLDPILATVKYESEGDEHYRQFTSQGRAVVYVLWHGRLIPLGYRHRDQGVIGIVSRSRDGDWLAGTLVHWGFGVVRGSSSRGGRDALRGLVREARRGHSLAITPDGPRGPRQKMKPGALVAAQLSGAPIIPVAATATSGWWPERWDRFLIPKPFANVRIKYGAPVWVPRESSESDIAKLANELEVKLNEMTAELDAA